MRTTLSVLGAALLLGGGACGRGDAGGMSDAAFVKAMSALEVIARDEGSDSLAKAAARRKVLQEEGLTPEGLERKARALAGDPKRAGELWARIDSLALAERGRRSPADEDR
jgi:hypothetical protein